MSKHEVMFSNIKDANLYFKSVGLNINDMEIKKNRTTLVLEGTVINLKELTEKFHRGEVVTSEEIKIKWDKPKSKKKPK